MKLNELSILLLGCLFVLLAEPTMAEHARFSGAWWNEGWEARVPVAVEPRPGLLLKHPVVLRWGDIAEKLGDVEVMLSSVRLVEDGELVPFQVDHRDAKGDFLPPGNPTLDPEDELVFVTAEDRRAELYLYVSEGPKPPVTFPSGVTVRSLRRGQAHQMLSAAGLEIDVQGTGLLDVSVNVQANSARGSVPRLNWKGVEHNRMGTDWSVFMNGHPFPTGAKNRWQAVKLLVDGPVRKVVGVRCDDSTSKAADGSVVLRADVTRYFSVFADVPLYDVEDVVHCSQVQENWTGTYTNKCHAGHDRDAADVLWDGSSGSVRLLPLADKNITREYAASGNLVSTDDVVDRWYAWFDEKERMGLAVFYGHSQNGGEVPLPARIAFAGGWEMWSTVSRASFIYQGLKSPTTLRHRFRVVGLGDASPEQVADEYRLWEEPASAFAGIGKIERR